MQEDTYTNFPGKGRWPIITLGALLIILALAFALLVSVGNFSEFSLSLTAFFIADHALWFHYRQLFKKAVQTSRADYRSEKQFFELEMLNIVVNQIFGKWRLYRFIAGTMIVAVADVFALWPAFREASGSLVTKACPWVAVSDGAALFYSIIVLLFVLVMEVWHWLFRADTYFRLRALETLEQMYALIQRRT